MLHRLLMLNKPEWPYIAGGMLGSLIGGAQQPLFAFGE
jgi:hypothetical protein